MSLNAEVSKLIKHGKVTVCAGEEGGVLIVTEGFEVEGGSCRDVSVQACLWAIGELQRETLKAVEKPGGGSISVD